MLIIIIEKPLKYFNNFAKKKYDKKEYKKVKFNNPSF